MNKYIVGISLLLALLAGCSGKQGSGTSVHLPPDISAGKLLAQKTCSACHGMDGRGVKDDIPNLAAQTESYLLKVIQTYDHGKRTDSSGGVMKVAKELTPNELRNAIAYYANLPPLGKPGDMSASYSYYDRGEALSKPCAGCHGDDGNPKESGLPRLAGQHPQYLIKATKAYQDGERSMPTMHEKLAGLSQTDMENIAIYFALNKPKAAANKAANPYKGKQFTYNCIECHGSTGSSSSASIPNLAGQDVQYLNTMIKAYRDKARNHGMMHQIIGEFKNSDVEKIALFFASEQPAQMNFVPPEPISSLAKKCDRCHGLDGANPEMLAPKLKGQNRSYLIKALTEYRDGDRGNSAMHIMSSTLYFNATLEGIASHYAAQAAR